MEGIVLRVCLINPPMMELEQPSAYISLGLAYLGTALRNHGIAVRVLDLATLHPSLWLDKEPPEADWYGISCVSATYPETVKIAKWLRERTGSRIVVGGVHPTILPRKTQQETGADYVIMGEADYALPTLVLGGYAPTMNHVIDGGTVFDLDGLGLPSRDLFSRDSVIDVTGIHGQEKGVAATSLVTSRGCPYSCAFCTKMHPMFRLPRYRSPGSVDAELLSLEDEYGIRHVRFVDDTFTLNKDRVIRLCAVLRKRHPDLTWVCITRADKTNYTMFREMRAAGCVEVHMGVESGSPRLLERMRKGETIRNYIDATAKARKAGLRVKVYIMYNFPGETDEDREATLRLMRILHPDKVTVSRFTPTPGCDVWYNPQKYGLTRSEVEDREMWFYPDESDKSWMDFKNRVIEASKSGTD